jgi:hypothetical protein
MMAMEDGAANDDLDNRGVVSRLVCTLLQFQRKMAARTPMLMIMMTKTTHTDRMFVAHKRTTTES